MSSEKVFISYSRQNRMFVDQLAEDLGKANFSLWLDIENLTPGTPSWERSIREAIQNAAVVVLVASPSALQSDYVQGELTVAKLHNRPIYPIWASGDNWIDCVPLDMANYQYADGRDSSYEEGINKLILTLNQVIDTSQGAITVGLPTYEMIRMNLAEFSDARSFLDTLFVRYGVQDSFDIWTYGKDWVLGNVNTRQLLLPFSWLALDHSIGISKAEYEWANKPLSAFNVTAGDFLAVWPISNLRIKGFAVNSQAIFDRVISKYGIREIEILTATGKIRHQDIGTTHKIEFFKHQFLIGLMGKYEDGYWGLNKSKKYTIYVEV
jgi:TIR domain